MRGGAAIRVLAVVPARGGSKGLPGKNLAPVGGRSLVARAVDAARGCPRVGRVIVSSDDDAILEAARRAGAEPLRRPPALATDEARSEPVALHALDALADWRPDVLCLLQPTSPLREAGDVDAALALLEADPRLDAVVSVFEPRHSPWKAFRLGDDGHLHGLVDDDAPFRPRQSLPPAYYPNGAVYAVRSAVLRGTGRLVGPRTAPLVMSRERSLDVDDAADLAAAEAWLSAAGGPDHARSKSLQKTTSAPGSAS